MSNGTKVYKGGWRTCPRCKRLKDVQEFDPQGRRKYPTQEAVCRRCYISITNHSRQVNKELIANPTLEQIARQKQIIEDVTTLIAKSTNENSGPLFAQKREILIAQGGRCFYCANYFGSLVWTRRRPNRILRIEWDHVLPWVFSLSNYHDNFVAACQVCNGIKGSKLFYSIQDAVDHVQGEWKKRGYKAPAPEEQRRMPKFAR